MGLIFAFIITFLVSVLAWCGWSIIQNEFAFKDMMGMMVKMKDLKGEEWWELMREQDAVSYDTHFKTRQRLGNWRNLYPKFFAKFPEHK
jgi:hypothetical protein